MINNNSWLEDLIVVRYNPTKLAVSLMLHIILQSADGSELLIIGEIV